MKTRAKILLDRAIGVPLAWSANLAARTIAPFARRDHGLEPEHIRTIAVSKVLGMGSIIQATPLLSDLRAHFPNAKLVFITSRANRELMERLDLVDESVYIDDTNATSLATSMTKAVLELLSHRIDLYFDLEIYSAAASVVSLVSGARNRVGFYRHSAKYKQGIFTHLTVFNPRAPISAIYRQLYHAVGGPPRGEPRYGTIRVSAEDDTSLESTLVKASIKLPSRFIVVNANASDLLLERRWPRERYAEVIETLARRGEHIVLIGAKSERAYVASIVEQIAPELRTQVIDTSGRLSLGELFALLKRAACVVTNDTGPMHFAMALDRPTVCLFGPVSPDHYGVRKPNVEMIYHPVYCSPCAHELDEPPCAGDNVCMQLIAVSEVVQAIERRLKKKAARRLPIADVSYIGQSGNALGVIVRASLTAGSASSDGAPTVDGVHAPDDAASHPGAGEPVTDDDQAVPVASA